MRPPIATYQDARFVRAVCQILVHAPGLGLGGCDGNAHLGGVVKQVVSASKTFKKLGQAPGGNHFDSGLFVLVVDLREKIEDR